MQTDKLFPFPQVFFSDIFCTPTSSSVTHNQKCALTVHRHFEKTRPAPTQLLTNLESNFFASAQITVHWLTCFQTSEPHPWL